MMIYSRLGFIGLDIRAVDLLSISHRKGISHLVNTFAFDLSKDCSRECQKSKR